MKLEYKKIWIFLILIILLYTFKIPLLGMPFYRVIYPIEAILLFSLIRKYANDRKCYLSDTSYRSISVWITLALLGIMIALVNGSLFESGSYIIYDICFAAVVLVISYYYRNDNYTKFGEMIFFLFSSVIALSGFYESLTGNFYHLTHESYAYYKNNFGFYRPNTIFYNVNDSAVFMCMALIVSFLYASHCTKHGRFVQVSSLILFGGNIILTGSRGALFGLVIFLYIFISKSIKVSNRLFLFMMFLPVLASGVYWLLSFIDTSDMNMADMGGRGIVWAKSLYNLYKSHFIGCGPGMTNVLNGYVENYGNSVSAIHSFFLEITCDYGVIGGTMILVWFIRIIVKIRKIIQINPCSLIIYAGFLAFIPLSVTSSSLIGKAWLLCFFGILIGEINRIEVARYYSELEGTVL